MAKDGNTMAKRQREFEKKRKAEEKREKRSRRKTGAPEVEAEAPGITPGEMKVLALFRKYLMSPGQMLCLNSNDVESMGDSLEKMVSDGLLVPEDMKGGYALTRKGFEAMNVEQA